MNKQIFITLTALLFIACSGGGDRNRLSDETAFKNEIFKDEAISTAQFQKMLKTGMDVDWVKTDSGREWAQKSHDEGVNVPQIFKDRGFSHVRIRIKEDVLSDEKFERTGKTLLEEITALVDDCIDAEIIPVLAYQGADFKDHPTDDEVLEGVVSWWKRVAESFKDRPYTLAYDIIIETTDEVKKHNDRLNLLYQKVAEAVHLIDENRIVIVAPNKISNPYELEKLEVPTPSEYVMVEWHFYAAGPKKVHDSKRWTTGTDEEKKMITDRVDAAVLWSEEHNIATWVGAWMANNYKSGIESGKTLSDGAPATGEYSVSEQVEVASFISQTLQDAGVPYAVNSDTKFFNRETNKWYGSMKSVLDAMISR